MIARIVYEVVHVEPDASTNTMSIKKVFKPPKYIPHTLLIHLSSYEVY